MIFFQMIYFLITTQNKKNLDGLKNLKYIINISYKYNVYRKLYN